MMTKVYTSRQKGKDGKLIFCFAVGSRCFFSEIKRTSCCCDLRPLYSSLLISRDRKLKKFVGYAGDEPSKKKIRTEEGTLLPVSFRSGRYETWQKKHKLSFQDQNDSESDEGERKENYLAMVFEL